MLPGESRFSFLFWHDVYRLERIRQANDAFPIGGKILRVAGDQIASRQPLPK